MKMPVGFDQANNKKEDESVRHIVLWAKYHYGNATEEELKRVIGKITGIEPKDITKRNELYWLKKACKHYNIEGYDIVQGFIDRSFGLCDDYDTGLDQLIATMRSKLMGLKVKETKRVTLYDLGEPDLFEEE